MGCPFDCIFCNQKKISGQAEEMTEDKVREVINTHLLSANENAYVEIGFYGGSFTGIEKNKQIKYLKIAHEFVKQGKVKEIRLSTRPDYIDEEILGYLKEHNVRTIELGVQSLDPEVLVKTCRGHSAEQVIASARLITERGFKLGIQTMIGLPGDSREKDIQTAKRVIELSPQLVRIYPALVIKNTYMEEMFRLGMYTPLSLNDAVSICAELLLLYEENNINVIRIGLQPSDNINENMDVVSGPFHPAFRQLVQSRLMLNKIEKIIKDENLAAAESILIKTNTKNISNVIGQKKENIYYLKAKYNYKHISIKTDETHENIINISVF